MTNNQQSAEMGKLLPLVYKPESGRIYDAKGRTVADVRLQGGRELSQAMVDAINRAQQTAAPVDAWLPIEGAPKEEYSRFLVCSFTDNSEKRIALHKPDGTIDRCQVADFYNIYEATRSEDGQLLDSGEVFVSGHLTHWQPLPAPPNARLTQAEDI